MNDALNVTVNGSYKSIRSEVNDLLQCNALSKINTDSSFNLVKGGWGTLIVGKNLIDFKSGDILYIGSCIPHVFKFHNQEAESSIYKIYFDPINNLRPFFDLPEMVPFKIFFLNFSDWFKFPAEHVGHLKTKILEINNLSGPDLLFSFLELLMIIKDIDIIALSSKQKPSLNTSDSDLRLEKILTFVANNYKKQITLFQVANEASMTPQAFCRYFKQSTGKQFVTFLNEFRVREICKRILERKKASPISSYAYDFGFNSVSNFNLVFKNVVGMSPKEYMLNI